MTLRPLAGVTRRPRVCIWEITGACNLRCLHCANHSGTRSPRELPLARMLEVAASLARLGCRTVEVTGGEPLLRPDWDRFCRGLRDLGLQVALITNGLLLDDAALDRALAAGVGHVAVSLDGLREVHDATRLRPGAGPSPWEEALAALRRALGRVPTTAITQVNRHNLPQLPDLHALLREMGVPRWQIQLAVPTGRVRGLSEPYVVRPEDLEDLTAFIAGVVQRGGEPAILTSDTIGYCTEREVLLRRRPGMQALWIGCLAGFRSVAITFEGRVRACSMFPEEFDAGDLHEERFEAIWSDEGRFACRERLDPRNLAGACGRCRHGPLCRAGCASMAWWTTGTIYDNPYCLHRVRRDPRLTRDGALVLSRPFRRGTSVEGAWRRRREMSLDWLPRESGIKDHDLWGEEHFGKEPPCTTYELKPVKDAAGNVAKGLHTAWVTLNNPAQYNSYTTKMVKGVIAGFHRASMDRSVVAVVFTGAGDKAFCTGGNTKEYAEYYSMRPNEYGMYMDLFNAMIDAILGCKKPTICRVNGMRVAGGQEIGTACDLTMSADTAVFGQAGPRHGSAPDGGSSDFLPWFLGIEDAMWSCVSCELWSAYKMKRVGLVTKVAPVLMKGGEFIRNPLVVTDKWVDDGEIVFGEMLRGEAAKQAKAALGGTTTDFTLLDKAVDEIVWTFANLFPGCLIKSVEGIRLKKKFFWDQAKVINRHWLAANMSGEAFLGFTAFNTRKQTGKDVIDFLEYRRLLTEGRTLEPALFEAVLPKPK